MDTPAVNTWTGWASSAADHLLRVIPKIQVAASTKARFQAVYFGGLHETSGVYGFIDPYS